MTAKEFYRMLRRANRIAVRGPMSAYVAEKIRLDALSRAIGEVVEFERIRRAAA